MKEFAADRLSAALFRVREAHPALASRFEHGEGLDSMVGEVLVRKLRSAGNVDTLIQSLTAVERRLVGAFLSHPEPDVRRAVYAIARKRSDLITTRQLWLGFQAEADGNQREPLKEVLLGRDDLVPLQKLLLQPLDQLWWFDAVMDEQLNLEQACERAMVLPGPLQEEIEAVGIMSGFVDVWALFEPLALRDGLLAQSGPIAGATWTAFAQIQQSQSPSRLVELRVVKVFLDVVRQRRRILDSLDQEARRFINTLLTWFELHDFFAEDNDRFRYWSKYADRMEAVMADRTEQALLMDFGHIGVVEFGTVGNAGYVYGSDYIERLKEHYERRGKLPFSRLKDRDLALHRIIHSSGWKSSTDYYLRMQGV